VAAEIIAHERGDKVISFKKRRRKNSRRKRGYRDEYSLIRITEILTDGKKPTVEARKRKEKPAKTEADAAEGKPAAKAKAAPKKPAAKAAAKKPAAKPAAKPKKK
jgi:large subunit ribosomal protein L21